RGDLPQSGGRRAARRSLPHGRGDARPVSRRGRLAGAGRELPGAAGGDEHGAVPPPGADPARRVPLGHVYLAGDGGAAVGADRGDPVHGRVGLYPCRVRIADIEDLIANSLGAWIGALVAPVLSRLGVPLFTREERPAGHLGGSGPWNDA